MSTKIRKKNFQSSRLELIIGLAVVLAVLLLGYFLIIRPLLKDDGTSEGTSLELIWESEVKSSASSVLLYPVIERDNISRIEVHNPENEEQYIDWGFYYCDTSDETIGTEAGNFYLTDYEYAPYDDASFSYMVTSTGYVLCSSRVEDHCKDFSVYGLDFDDLSEAKYFKVTSRDGQSHIVVIGDKLPSGSGYYIRSLDTDKCLEDNSSYERDSVYVISDVYTSSTLLSDPRSMVVPYLTYPVNYLSELETIAIWSNEEKYYTNKLDENGKQVYDEDGKAVITWSPAIYAKPASLKAKDPFSVFSSFCAFYLVNPAGYYGSQELENLTSVFQDFEAQTILELGRRIVSEDGGELIGFTDEIYKKYHLSNPRYMLYYRGNGIDNYLYFSELQEKSYYYVYSTVFNTITRVDLTTAYFMDWDLNSYVLSQIFYLKIDNCQSVELKGSYYDLGTDNDQRKGLMTIDHKYQLEGLGNSLEVIEQNSSRTVDTKNFRQLYRVMLQTYVRNELDGETVENAKSGDPYFTMTVVTRPSTVYKKDSSGNATTEVDYVLPSVTRIYRFYTVTGGRTLCTIEDIDDGGKSSGENGSFYMMTASVQKIMASSIDLINGIEIDASERG
ncbi:MAG: DUF4340 domain-containing protein [Clostridia bacterium]|nr:DUF4340 domain-containing protein [Clostridia bacterium]